MFTTDVTQKVSSYLEKNCILNNKIDFMKFIKITVTECSLILHSDNFNSDIILKRKGNTNLYVIDEFGQISF